MTTTLSNAARTAAATALVGLIDAGAGAGKVEIRTGGQPAGPGSAATGTLLVTIPLNDPAFDSLVNGVATADVVPNPEANAVADGTAGWFRVLDSNNVAIIDGDVTDQMTLNTVNIVTGVAVRITAYTITMPAS